MKQTNERLCALAQKGDAAALDSPVSYTHLNGFVFVDSIGIELMNVKEGSLLGERGLDS